MNEVAIGKGQLIFALLFFAAFIAVMIWAFKKDKGVNSRQFGNSGTLALILGGLVFLLVVMKFILRNLSP